ncbi:MAG: hypothetical protein U9R52_00140 [Candidatus Omnitrophota bacterium]|nr:hypothetical protein [Candidatus Omnitrophota bacterium]
MKIWRSKNPDYFKYKEMKDVKWKDACRERARHWRLNHLEYLKLYRQEHREAHKEYMRKYMRDYRKKKKENTQVPNVPSGGGNDTIMGDANLPKL